MSAAIVPTFTGRCVDLFRIHEDDIDPVDIAHHLALINRFCGATRVPVSVAQHSVYVSRLCDSNSRLSLHGTRNGLALQALLHDASEAYLGDITKWFKQHPAMEMYRALEDQVQRTIYRHFNLPEEDAPEVKEADKLMVRYEAMRMLNCALWRVVPEDKRPAWAELTKEEMKPIGAWFPWNWADAERMFMSRLMALMDPDFDDIEGVQLGLMLESQ
jgi:5'-deoxynucleotidase YfbR-like HD superfamily hydrolase